jgi:hypothetical protein
MDNSLVKRKNKKKEIEESTSFKMVRNISKFMDDWYIDPIIGLIPWIGDIFSPIFSLPFIYVSLFKVRSIPLTLAIIFNMLMDTVIGMIPFYIGNVADFFYKGFRKNMRLIVGFVEGDEETIKKVNRRAIIMAILIVILTVSTYFLIKLHIYLYNLICGLFS